MSVCKGISPPLTTFGVFYTYPSFHLIGALNDSRKRSRFPYSILGHVADGNFHCFVMLDPNDPQQHEEIRELTHQLTNRILAMGGTCTGEHGIGLGKIDDLVNETGQAGVAVMRSIKSTLDPNNILNPGKIIHK